MTERWGSRFLLVVLVLSLGRFGEGQQGAGVKAVQELHHGPALTALVGRPTLECAADSGSMLVGQTGVIRARGVSPVGSALVYSFTASAGQLVVKGNVAELRTGGVSPQVVRVTCTVRDGLGNSASKVVGITLRKAVELLHQGGAPITIQHLPAIPLPITKGESAAPPPMAQPAPPPPPPHSDLGPVPVQGVSPHPQHEKAAEDVPTDNGHQQDAQQQGGYQQGKTFDDWVKGLKTGKIEYQVPKQMLMQKSSTATVVIHGYGDTAAVALPDATGSGSLIQSESMKVELLAEDHPGDFTIVPQSDAVQFIPINGSTTWTWSVTPNSPGNKNLMVRASVIYPGGDGKMAEQLKPYQAVVAVNVPSLWSNIIGSYRNDPLKWFSYVIPGGAGFTFLVGILIWWRKKKGKE